MTFIKPIKVGIIGVGHLGKFHVQQLCEIESTQIVGLSDTNIERANEVGAEFKINVFENVAELMALCDAVSIVAPTSFHYQTAKEALEKGCHIFIEKPITETIQQAQKLLKLANKKNRLIQVGHIERFNPAFMVLRSQSLKPNFIECHRLAPFNPRGTDVPVVLDLMIHDLDILLHMIDGKVSDIQANGVKVVSSTVDIANARITFTNGCVANVTASRISQGSMRKMRIFQKKSYTIVDFLEKSVETYHIKDNILDYPSEQIINLEGKPPKYILYNKPEVKNHNALKEELVHFVRAIQKGSRPLVDGHDATQALKLAMDIQKIIDEHPA
jgi:predicted dehydrogenase